MIGWMTVSAKHVRKIFRPRALIFNISYRVLTGLVLLAKATS